MKKLLLIAIAAASITGCSKAPETAITLNEYNKLTPGTSITQAQVIIEDQGVQKSAANNQIVYEWKNPDGSSATATFVADQLTTKSQTGLK